MTTVRRRVKWSAPALVALLVAATGCGGREPASAPSARWVPSKPARAATDGPARVAVVENAGLHGTRLAVVDLGSGGRRRVVARSASVRGGDAGLAAPAFSPDGRWVAAAEGSNTADGRHVIVVVVAAVDGGGTARRIPGVRLVDVDAYRPAWTPDGSAIAVPTERGVDLVDVRSGRRRALIDQRGSGVAFAPDGRSYAFDGPGGIWLVTKGHQPRLVARDAQGAAWSPDSRRLAYLSTRDRNGEVSLGEAGSGTAHEIYVARRDGSGARRLTRTTADEMGPLRWTVDGRAVVHSRFGDGRLTANAVDAERACATPLSVVPAARPPGGDVTDWDVRASAPRVAHGC